MHERLHGRVHVDLCRGCGACWLDAGELAEQPGAPEGLEESLRARLDRAPLAALSCPRCAGGLRNLEVPQGLLQPCASCGGLLMDGATTRVVAGLAVAAPGALDGAELLDLGGEAAELGLELALHAVPDALDGAALLARVSDVALPEAADGAALLQAQDPVLAGVTDGATLLEGAGEGLAEGFMDGSAALEGLSEGPGLMEGGAEWLGEGAGWLTEGGSDGAEALLEAGGGALEVAGELLSGAAELAGAVVSGTLELLGALLD
ncbi:MAG: zf-TFIIB domain-containing protein [Alphaproteobacteria bacterium]|nr:zf-TFIIB domain-containing protein [Alphaproteobacteria bacterium]